MVLIAMRLVMQHVRAEQLVYQLFEQINAKNLISEIRNKVTGFCNRIANIFAPREIDEFAFAIA